MSIQNIDPKLAKAMQLDSQHGTVIAVVFADGPAQKAGLLEGDANSLRTVVAMIRPGHCSGWGTVCQSGAIA